MLWHSIYSSYKVVCRYGFSIALFQSSLFPSSSGFSPNQLWYEACAKGAQFGTRGPKQF